MPTRSPQRVSRLLSCSCSFTNGCADPSPTAVFVINPMPSGKPNSGLLHSIVPTRRSRKSSICSPSLDAAA